jgi:chemotaxis protein histidine kinase CheA
LPAIAKSTPKENIRYAPSFLQGEPGARGAEAPYNAASLGAFLGWSVTKTKRVLAALELLERAVLKEDDFEGLTVRQSRAVVQAAHAGERAAESMAVAAERDAENAETPAQKKRAEAAAAKHRAAAPKAATAAAREEAKRQRKDPEAAPVELPTFKKQATPASLDKAVRTLCGDLLDGFDKQREKLDWLVAERADVDPKLVTDLVNILGRIATSASEYAAALDRAPLQLVEGGGGR